MSAPALAAPAVAAVRHDAAELRRAFALFPTGLVVVAAHHDDGPVGLLVSSFTSVSLDPAIVSVNIAVTSTSLPKLRESGSWGISVLAHDHAHVGAQFRRPAAERFSGLDWRTDAAGAVTLDGASATFTGRPMRLIRAGDHHIALLAVDGYATAPQSPPLLFHRSTIRPLPADVCPT